MYCLQLLSCSKIIKSFDNSVTAHRKKNISYTLSVINRLAPRHVQTENYVCYETFHECFEGVVLLRTKIFKKKIDISMVT